jgi:hypothetical protein
VHFEALPNGGTRVRDAIKMLLPVPPILSAKP